ncbi:MAG: VOC family protein [Flavobacteriaceae bacterium]|nr:VOC family protein [Flavobacteriaceae bacterium]
MEKYTVPPATRIGHIHLKVSDLERALKFYRDLLGFEVTQMYGQQAAFLSAGGYHHHIGLNTWHSAGYPPATQQGVGMYHAAILYSERKDLAQILKRLMDNDYPLTGESDHGVSEAIYLNDPDGNGLELYWDKPAAQWPRNAAGQIEMHTRRLDIEDLLNTIKEVNNNL